MKRLAETALLHSGIPWIRSRIGLSRGLVLAYHNVLPRGASAAGDLSLHLPQASFAAQLDVLQGSCDVVPLADLASGRTEGRLPRVAITFDDAYQGAVTAGVAELAARGLPATIFVAPHFLGGHPFWWDSFSTGAGLAGALRSRALQELAGRDEAVREWARETGVAEQRMEVHSVAATEEELRRATASPGITLGSHTWSHPNLARLAGTDLDTELARPLAWLQERFDRTIRWISYPYGLSSPDVARRAAAVGYEGGLLVSGGWMTPRHEDRFALPRLNVPARLSTDGLRLRLRGMLCN